MLENENKFKNIESEILLKIAINLKFKIQQYGILQNYITRKTSKTR